MATSDRDTAFLCGGCTVCILVCMLTAGIPMFFSGIGMVSAFHPGSAAGIVGIVLIVISCIFIIIGLVAGAMTLKYAGKSALQPTRVRHGAVISGAPTAVYTTQGHIPQGYAAQPPAYPGTQYPGAAQQPQYPGNYHNASQAQYAPPGRQGYTQNYGQGFGPVAPQPKYTS